MASDGKRNSVRERGGEKDKVKGKGEDSPPKWRAPLFAAALALCAYRAIEYHNYWNSLSPVVEVKQGPLQGRASRTDSGTEFFAFQGIPYATPPLGPLRFRDPQPPASWGPDVRDARADGPVCSQGPMPMPTAIPSNISIVDVVRFLGAAPALLHRAVKLLRQSEDCLHLSVYTPKVGAGSLPVFVYFHGGAFVYGDNGIDMVGPHHLVERDVVVVAANYRLGVLGFLALGEAADTLVNAPEGVGNAGLKDAVAVLRWVRDNIAQFGGDPGKVTVGGQSAGSIIAHYLTLMPPAKGLFRHAILMSGVATVTWGHYSPRTALERTQLLVRRLLRPEVAGGPGAPSAPDVNNPEDVLRFLREVDIRLLVDRDNFVDLEEESKWLTSQLPYQPTSDGVFVPAAPVELIRSGRFHQVPVMVGMAAREGLFAVVSAMDKKRSLKELAEIATGDFRCFLPESVRAAFATGSLQMRQVEAAIKQHFFGGRTPVDASLDQLLDYYGFVMLELDTQNYLETHAAVSNAPIFAYNFTFEGRNNLFRRTMLYHVPELKGTTHCDDLSYLFHIDILPHISFQETDPEMEVQRNLVTLFTDFIKFGNPTPSTAPESGVLWPPVTKDGTPVLKIDVINSVQQGGFKPKEVQFWNRAAIQSFSTKRSQGIN